MAITTYTELKRAIIEHLNKDGLTKYLDDFISMSEAVFNFGMKSDGYDVDPLRVRDMETVSTLTPTAGVVTLPATFLEPRRVVEAASIRRPLDYITPETVEHYYPTRPSGLANHYTIIGSSLYTFPLATNNIDVHHYRTIPPLVSNDPNWLLTKHPTIYLRASLMHAAIFAKDDAEALKHGAMLRALVAGMNAADARATFVDGGVQLRGPTP